MTIMPGLGIECLLGYRVGSIDLEGFCKESTIEDVEMRHEGIAKITKVCTIFHFLGQNDTGVAFESTWDT